MKPSTKFDIFTMLIGVAALAVIGWMFWSLREMHIEAVKRRELEAYLKEKMCLEATVCPEDRIPVYFATIDQCGCFPNNKKVSE
jgi:hypothetical protein